MKKFFLLLALVVCFLFVSSILQAQGLPVDGQSLISHVEELSSPNYSGRLTGTPGNELAVKYISDYFDSLGLIGPNGKGYEQRYSQRVLVMKSPPVFGTTNLNTEETKTYSYSKDFTASLSPGSRLSGKGDFPMFPFTTPDGIDRIADLKDTFVLVSGQMLRDLGIQKIMQAIVMNASIKGVVLETALPGRDRFPASMYVDPNYRYDQGSLFVFSVTPEVFSELVQVAQTDLLSISLDFEIQSADVANVIGIIPGSSSSEHVIIGAHLDGSGTNLDGTYNPSAHDNASGVAVLLETARLLRLKDKAPRKTIVFVAFNGEEQGTYGSEHYVNHPVFPLRQGQMINLDSVAAKGGNPIVVEDFPGANTSIKKTLLRVAKNMGIDAIPGQSRGVDHTPFAEKGVPAVNIVQPNSSVFHGIEDTIEVLSIDSLENVARILASYLIETAY